MGLSSQLQEATRGKKRLRKPKAPSPGEQILLAAASKANAQFEYPEALDGLIENAVADRVQALLRKVYGNAKQFKTTRTDEISDDEQVNYGTYDDPDEIDYYARVEYPAEVVSSVTASLNSKLFSRNLSNGLIREAEVSQPAASKIASDRDVLAFAGKQALESVIKSWEKNNDPPDEDSDIAERAKDFAYRDADDVRMSADPKQPEILHVADLELEVRSVKSKLYFISPWKFKVETTFGFKADLKWDDYS